MSQKKDDISNFTDFNTEWIGCVIPGKVDDIGKCARLNKPGAMALDMARRSLYVVDTGNDRICRISLFDREFEKHVERRIRTTPELSTFPSDLLRMCLSYWDAFGQVSTVAEEICPRAIAVELNSGHLLCTVGNTITRVFAPFGSSRSVAGNTELGEVNDEGEHARFTKPKGIACDRKGDALICDSLNNQIRRCSPCGRVSTAFAWWKELHPKAIVVDQKSDMYVLSGDGSEIILLTPDTDEEGAAQYSATCYCGEADGLRNASDFAVDLDGSLWVADLDGISYVRPFQQEKTPLIGLIGTPGGKKETSVVRIALDPIGRWLFAADAHGHTIHRIKLPPIPVLKENGTGGSKR